MAGQDFVKLALPSPPNRPSSHPRNPTKKATAQTYDRQRTTPPENVRGFEAHLYLIGEPYGFHEYIYKAVWSYFAQCRLIQKEPDFIYLKNRLRETIFAADPGGRSTSEIQRYASDRYLDSEIKGGYKKFCEQERREPAKADKPFYEDRAVPLDEARTILGSEISRFFDDVFVRGLRPNLVLAPDVGVGKTEEAVKNIARIVKIPSKQRRKILYFVPTHELGFEIEQRLKKAGLNAFHFRGRGADGPNDNGKMCADLERVQLVRDAGLKVDQYACGSRKQKEFLCPLHEICLYQQQKPFLKDADVIIMAHNMLFLPPPTKINVSCIVIDESFLDAAIDKNESLSIKDMRKQSRELDFSERQDYGRLIDKLEKAISLDTSGRLTRENMNKAKISLSEIENVLSSLQSLRCLPSVAASMKTSELRSALLSSDSAGAHAKTVELWKILEWFLSSQDAVCPKIKVTGDNKIKILSRRNIHKAYDVPTLFLDATARQEIIRFFFPDAAVVQIEVVKPHQYIRQIYDTAIPYHSFRQLKNNPDERNAAGVGVVKKIRDFVEIEAIRYKRSTPMIDVLVICPKEMREILETLPPLPENVDVTHFGAFRGKDRWRNVRKIIIVSRPLPPAQAVAEMAEALSGQTVPDADYDFVGKAMRTKNAGYPVIESQPLHPENLAEAIRWAKMEGELIQAVGRGRGVNRGTDNPVHIDILTNVVLPLTVDETLRRNDILLSRYDKMWAEGFIIFNSDDQARVYPDLFDTAETAKSYKKNLNRNRGHSSIESYIIEKCHQFPAESKNPALTHKMTYRVGRRGPRKTLFFDKNRFKHPAAYLSFFMDVREASTPEPLA